MTSDDSGTGAPPPFTGCAGLSRDGWIPLRVGDELRCLAVVADRRRGIRGVERRSEPHRCNGKFGRIGPGMAGAWMRLAGSGRYPAPGPVIYLQCWNRSCQRAHELLVVTQAEAA